MDTPTFSTAAVAAPHRLAAATGRNVLAAGGNAIEAMVAMAATMAVVDPHMNGIGGDGLWLVREPGGRVRGIEACGPAGARATIRHYRDLGYDAVPGRGPDAALTVAGTVGGWSLAMEYAKSLGGRMDLADLLADAIRHAKEGCEVSASELRTEPGGKDALWAAPGFAAAFGIDGKPPKAGDIRRSPKLADTLAYLAAAGLDDFYRGDVGREIGQDIERLRMPAARADYAAYRAAVREPLKARLAGATIYAMPPPSQGLAALLILGIHGQLGLSGRDGPAHHHGLIEATKRAVRIRDSVVADSGRRTLDPQSLLAPEFFAREAAAIDMKRAAPLARPIHGGGAIWMGAIDAQGLAVSCLQSLHRQWGSGCALPATGILLQSGGASFSLDPAAADALEPGRRPFHMPSPALAAFDDGRAMAYGSTGGDGAAQVFARHVDFGQSVGEAVEVPRWRLGRGSDEAGLGLEERFDPDIADGLDRLGHEVEIVPASGSDAFGHAGMLVKYPRNGRVEAMHDPRSDGGAEGL